MSKITKTASAAVDFLRGRIGARLLLILCCFMCFTAFTDNIGPIDITADGETQTIITLRNDPVEIISRAGLALETEDQLVVVKDEDSSVDAIEVLRGVQVTVIDAGSGTTFEIAANSTVADAIAKAGIQQPDSDDAMNCTLADTVYDYMEIIIDRVVYEERATNQVIEYKTVKHETSELLKGETRVAVRGANGEKRIVTQYKWVNGQLESQTVISETVIKDAVNEIVDVGTAVPVTTTKPTTAVNYNGGSSNKDESAGTFVDASGRTVSYKKVLTGTGTAYNEPAGSKTATGRPVQVGLVAVDPRVIPYGTNLYIVSADGKIVYGYALAADTGSALRNGDALVDLFYDSESQCLAFGRRDVIVYILED